MSTSSESSLSQPFPINQFHMPISDRPRRLDVRARDEERELAGEAIQIGIAANFRELCDAFRLVHDRYVESGYMEPHSSRMRYSVFQLLPVNRTFVATVNGQVTGTGCLVFDADAGLPSDQVFKPEFDRLRAAGRRIAEAGMFACDPVFDGKRGRVNMRLIHSGFPWAAAMGVESLCLVVNPKHVSFYQQVLGFEVISDSKSCSFVKDAPGLLLHLDLLALRSGSKELTPKMKNMFCGPLELEDCGHRLSAEEAMLLLLESPEILTKASPPQRAMLRTLYSSAPNSGKEGRRDWASGRTSAAA